MTCPLKPCALTKIRHPQPTSGYPFQSDAHRDSSHRARGMLQAALDLKTQAETGVELYTPKDIVEVVLKAWSQFFGPLDDMSEY